MDFEKIEEAEDYIIIRNVRNFNLKHIFGCGQCFRWLDTPSGSYIGVAYGKVIEIKANDEDIYLYNTNLKDVNEIWMEYFHLYRDYSDIKEELKKDTVLNEAISFGSGIRLLQQEPFEMVVSFIISSNNRIPMIKKCIENICYNWGEKLEYKGNTYYTFPKVEKLQNVSEEDFLKCSTGFRAKYIKDTVYKIYNESSFDLDLIKNLQDEDCHRFLQGFMGVGPKVSDCIMLFSMQKYSAFPVDVWVKRAMQHFYLAPNVSLKGIRQYGINKFGNLSGFAQQYLFYYARENKII